MQPTGSSAASAPLPPLPDLPAASPNVSAGGGPGNGMAGFLSGLMPVKSAVDGINGACQSIVQSGAVPGAEQVCAQIVALANSLVPMAAQNLLGAAGQMQGGGMPPPPPGMPPPVAPGPGGPGGPGGGPVSGQF